MIALMTGYVVIAIAGAVLLGMIGSWPGAVFCGACAVGFPAVWLTMWLTK
jgi:hypothetical protein